jgi:hypothetical protein
VDLKLVNWQNPVSVSQGVVRKMALAGVREAKKIEYD